MIESTTICIEFRIMGEQFDIDSVTQALNISPTEFWRKGTPIYSSQGEVRTVRKYTNWCYSTGTTETLDVNTQIEKIEDAFESKTNILLQLKKKYNLSFSIDIIVCIKNEQPPALCLKDFILKMATELNAHIDTDIQIG